MASLVRIGVDVGGTNTDAVILDPSASRTPTRGVLAFHKTRTTSPEVTDGIETAIRAVLEKSRISRDRVQCLVIGTTHFINAVIESDHTRLVRPP
jgi:N-methylhydantoinase A/oxoprolinase/acetone carboxylase beta subunit